MSSRLYGYRCTACLHTAEDFRDEALASAPWPCPQCAAPMRRDYRVAVQNSTASVGSLSSVGRDLRVTTNAGTVVEKIARTERERRWEGTRADTLTPR